MKQSIFSRILAAAMIIATFAACTGDDDYLPADETQTENPWAQYDFVLADDYSVLTRVTYGTDTEGIPTTTTFTEGDKVGVFVLTSNKTSVGTEYENLKYKVALAADGVTKVLVPSSDEGRKVVKSNDYRYMLYYPYATDMTPSNMESYSFTVRTDQSTEANVAASDLMWCYYTPNETDGSTYKIVFQHLMAQIVLKVTNSGDYGKTYANLINMPTTATINMLTGEIKSTNLSELKDKDDKGVNNPQINMYNYKTGSTNKEGRFFRALFPAHTLEKKYRIINIGGSTFHALKDVDFPFTFSQGTTYNTIRN